MTWVLPSGRRKRSLSALADLGELAGQLVREADRQRHQLVTVSVQA